MVSERIRTFNYLHKRGDILDLRNAFVRTRLAEKPKDDFKFDTDWENLPLEIASDRYTLTTKTK